MHPKTSYRAYAAAGQTLPREELRRSRFPSEGKPLSAQGPGPAAVGKTTFSRGFEAPRVANEIGNMRLYGAHTHGERAGDLRVRLTDSYCDGSSARTARAVAASLGVSATSRAVDAAIRQADRPATSCAGSRLQRPHRGPEPPDKAPSRRTATTRSRLIQLRSPERIYRGGAPKRKQDSEASRHYYHSLRRIHAAATGMAAALWCRWCRTLP